MELENMYTDVQVSRIWQLLFMHASHEVGAA